MIWTEGQIANVRVSVDFPGAEGCWVTSTPVYDGLHEGPLSSVPAALTHAVESVLRDMTLDAGRLLAEKRSK